MDQWEYHTEQFETKGFSGGKLDIAAFNARLNQLGAQGWELVNTFDTNMVDGMSRFVVAVFKRMV
ncbi:DUF4177 domain-containing protein [Fusibacter sp. JL298sf-3]